MRLHYLVSPVGATTRPPLIFVHHLEIHTSGRIRGGAAEHAVVPRFYWRQSCCYLLSPCVDLAIFLRGNSSDDGLNMNPTLSPVDFRFTRRRVEHGALHGSISAAVIQVLHRVAGGGSILQGDWICIDAI